MVNLSVVTVRINRPVQLFFKSRVQCAGLKNQVFWTLYLIAGIGINLDLQKTSERWIWKMIAFAQNFGDAIAHVKFPTFFHQ